MHFIEKCQVCNTTNFNDFLLTKDYLVSKEEFVIQNCKKCGFKFTNPIPNPQDLGNYYKSENYISHTDTKKGFVSKVYHVVRKHTLRKKIKLIQKYVSRGTILDFGCGTGMFLSECNKAGWQTFGIEPDEGARTIALHNSRNVYNNLDSLEAFDSKTQFNVITLWHVLEHIYELNITLKRLTERLSNNGVLIIAVPNYKSFDAKHYESYWAAYDVPRHLYHFDKNSISQLLSNHSFKLVDDLPMVFDSVYVSLLSEKYKKGRVGYFKAIYNGLKSNLRAVSSKEYSSKIYVFKRV